MFRGVGKGDPDVGNPPVHMRQGGTQLRHFIHMVHVTAGQEVQFVQVGLFFGDDHLVLRLFHAEDRFEKYPNLITEAADDGRLPVAKNYNKPDVGRGPLNAAIKFIETQITERSIDDKIEEVAQEFRGQLEGILEHSIRQNNLWLWLTLIFVGLSITILLVGAISTFFFDVEVSTLTSVSSIITAAISSLLFVQLRRSGKDLERNQTKIEEEYKASMDRLLELRKQDSEQ